MPSPSFFNENENRAYPLVAGTSPTPPTTLLVDAGFVASAKSRFVSGIHTVSLTAVRRHGSFFYVDFTSNAPELYGLTLTFSRHISDGDFVAEFVDSGTAGLSASSDSLSASDPRRLCDAPLWWGFLVTGRIAAFETLLPTDGEVTYAAEVEPALIQNMAGSFVSQLGTANVDRTRVTPAEGCGDTSSAGDTVHINATCVIGDVVFVAGYNANVRQNAQDNSITIGAAVGDGAGQPCDTIAVYPGESAPAGSTLLEGGPRCNETVRSVNGIGGPLLAIIAGNGVTVTASPDDHRVIVNVDMRGLALCQISYRSESC